jgi:hypothetical protein
MDKFKVAGNVILINRTGNEYLNDSIEIGDECTVTVVLDTCLQLNGLDDGWVYFADVKLIMPEPAVLTLPNWDIYNNSIPWGDLDDYQKGAFLSAITTDNKKVFTSMGMPLDKRLNHEDHYVYRARRFSNSESKSELTMVEKFEADWNICLVTLGCESMWDKMIAKGWVKNSDEPTAGVCNG